MSIEKSIDLSSVTALPQLEAGASHVAVIDVGSNSIRLVVYDGLSRAPRPLFNEKVLCGLGRGLSESGRLDSHAMARAVATIHRFVALARAQPLDALEVVATAAVREANNGAEFVAAVRDTCGIELRVISGKQEARLSALGVAAASPGATGLMGDMGGGSLEVVALDQGEPGHGATMALGAFRLQQSDDPASLIDEALAKQGWLESRAGTDLFVVGGAWRALGRMHMEREAYPLHILHGYAVPADYMAMFANVVANLGEASTRGISGLAQERRATVPMGALLLDRLLRRVCPRRVVFSAYGLREGLLFNLLDASARRGDPLLAGCQAMAEHSSRFPEHVAELMNWTDPLFPGESGPQRRLRHASALLSDIGWGTHPDYRAEHAFEQVLRSPLVGLDHAERVELSLSIYARYTGGEDNKAIAPLRALITDDAAKVALKRGLALRLAHTLSGGVPGMLRHTGLRVDDRRLTLWSTPYQAHLLGDVVVRRLERLARAFDLAPNVEPG